MALDRLGFFNMKEESFIKAYDSIMIDKEMDLYESYLLCRYISKYEQFGKVITSDEADAEYLGINRRYVGNKRRKLKELGHINYSCKKGMPTEIVIDRKILDLLGLN